MLIKENNRCATKMHDSPEPPLISVIVPVYNAERYVEECINSLRRQSYKNLEIIFVDDGSTDASLSILKKHQSDDSRITILQQSNSGQATARNKALAIATGTWITGVDADDFLSPDAYEYSVSLITPTTDVVCFCSTPISEAGCELRSAEKSYLINRLDGEVSDAQEALLNTNVYFWNKLWRKSFLDKYNLRFNDGLLYEDSAFTYSALPLINSIVYGKKALHYYRMHNQSTMTQTFKKTERALEHLTQLSHVLSFYKKYHIDKKMPKAIPFVFKNLYGAAFGHTPRQNRQQVIKEAATIVKKFNLLASYPNDFAITAAREVPWFLRPFVQTSFNKKKYCFFWIPVYVVKEIGNTRFYKILGISFKRRRFK